MDTIDEQIKQRLTELPEDVQQAIHSVDLGEKIGAIGVRHHLHIDQVGGLEDEIMLVMLGFSDPGTFTDHLEEELHIEKEEALAITQEVTEEFFLPIRESMKAFMAAQSASHTLMAPEAVPAVPMPAANTMLTEKTVVTPQPTTSTAPAPRAYTKDPYHEPIE